MEYEFITTYSEKELDEYENELSQSIGNSHWRPRHVSGLIIVLIALWATYLRAIFTILRFGNSYGSTFDNLRHAFGFLMAGVSLLWLSLWVYSYFSDKAAKKATAHEVNFKYRYFANESAIGFETAGFTYNVLWTSILNIVEAENIIIFVTNRLIFFIPAACFIGKTDKINLLKPAN